jgi:hypothetical protein
MHQQVDKDKSDTIDFEEFIQIMLEIENQTPDHKEQELLDAFNVSCRQYTSKGTGRGRAVKNKYIQDAAPIFSFH